MPNPRRGGHHGDMPELLLRDAANHLGVSLDTMRRRVRRGDLPARRDGRGRLLVTIEMVPPASAPGDTGDGQVPRHASGGKGAAPGRAYAGLLGTEGEASAGVMQLLIEVQAHRDQAVRQVEALNAQVAALTRQLDDAAVERAELRRLLAQALTMQQALPAGPADAPVVASPSDTKVPTARLSRPWWQLWRR